MQRKPSVLKKTQTKKTPQTQKNPTPNQIENFNQSFQLVWNSVGGTLYKFEFNNKIPMNSHGSCFIQHTFLLCIYCCGLWVYCRRFGTWLLSVICGSAAPLGQKWMWAGWCTFLWRWNGKILPGNSSASLPKTTWMQEVKYVWNQAHMP